MEYKKATIDNLKEILVMKNLVKLRVEKENLPIWKNGYPKDNLIEEDIINNRARIIMIDNEIVGYAAFHHASDDYEEGMFLKNNLQTFSRVMVKDNYVGKHIGDFLIKNLIKEAQTLDVNGLAIGVDSCNIKALNLYKKYGFKKEGEYNFTYAYLDLYSLYFEKEI